MAAHHSLYDNNRPRDMLSCLGMDRQAYEFARRVVVGETIARREGHDDEGRLVVEVGNSRLDYKLEGIDRWISYDKLEIVE